MNRQNSITSDSSMSTNVRRLDNVRMVQNVLAIWLDNDIDNNSVDCQHMIAELRHVVNTINTFTDVDQCEDFITDINNEKVIMIISDALCQNIVPLIHDTTQIDTIFIFGENQTEHDQWTNSWWKIKGKFTEISSICEALKQAARQCEQNSISISFMSTDNDVSNKNLDRLDISFMYTQILKEILLTIKFKQEHVKNFTDYCREQYVKNNRDLENINKFEQQYFNQTPIWWYSYEYFLYSMLNRSLRLADVDVIIKMGFFIHDLHRHIERLHSKQFNGLSCCNSFKVYRGQGMSKSDFEQMEKTKGGLISFNNFLSTSKDYYVSLAYAASNQENPDLVGILFVMTVDPSQSTTPFTSIIDISYYNDAEDEILFSMHTVFRISDIKPVGENHRLFQVDLTLTSDNDVDLRILTDRIRKETRPDVEGWYRLGALLFKMGQSEKAQHVYEILLDQATNDNDKASIYHQLGCAKEDQNEYNEAITYYEKSLEIEQKKIVFNHIHIANSYHNIGNVYVKTAEYSKALLYYEKALEIRQQSLSLNLVDLADSYANIGNVYNKMGDYSKALLYYKKADEIQQKSLPSNHPDLASTYTSMGTVYRDMGDFSQASLSYEKALKIRQESLLPNHPDLAASYFNIGWVYYNLGEYSKALSSYEKAVEIHQKSLHPDHLNLGMFYNNIALVYRNTGEYPKALCYLKKALIIKQKSLPPNHPDLATSYGNIGNVYNHMGEYSKALSSFQKSINIKQKNFGPNHPDLAITYSNMGALYIRMSDYLKARSSFERAVNIAQQSLPPNHPRLQNYRANLSNLEATEMISSLLASFDST